ncbi:hypothetical protein ACET3Z_032048 [Daucus carota]
MQSTSLRPLLPTSRTFPQNFSIRKFGLNQNTRRPNLFLASRRDAYDKNPSGRVVDENMIVLRMRIHDMKMDETNHEPNVPEKWMEWEKRYYQQSYSSDITKGVGILQLMLMNTRPSFALGMLALVLCSVLYSMGVAVFLLVDFAKLAIQMIRDQSLVRRDAYDKNGDGRVVDENMIVVLRMRIHDMKKVESNHEPNVPEKWMEREKVYYQQNYSSDIYNRRN